MTKDYLSEQLRTIADEVMDAEFAVSEKRRQRDALIVAASTAGLSLRTIGDLCMISHQSVRNIIERGSTAAGASATTTPGADRLA
jgi:hypothetical protein